MPQSSEFQVVPDIKGISSLRLGLSGAHQYQNATLAVHLSQRFLKSQANIEPEETLSSTYIEALQKARWPGRCQTVEDPQHSGTTWFLDGAHTLESLTCCVEWFVDPLIALRKSYVTSWPLDVIRLTFHNRSSRPKRVLIFNCTSGRSGSSFLAAMLLKLAAQLSLHGSEEGATEFFNRVIFCANV